MSRARFIAAARLEYLAEVIYYSEAETDLGVRFAARGGFGDVALGEGVEQRRRSGIAGAHQVFSRNSRTAAI
jgi:hypothetical protein